MQWGYSYLPDRSKHYRQSSCFNGTSMCGGGMVRTCVRCIMQAEVHGHAVVDASERCWSMYWRKISRHSCITPPWRKQTWMKIREVLLPTWMRKRESHEDATTTFRPYSLYGRSSRKQSTQVAWGVLTEFELSEIALLAHVVGTQSIQAIISLSETNKTAGDTKRRKIT